MSEQYGHALIDLLGNLRRGEFLADADDQLREVVQAVEETGRKGELTIRLTFNPSKSQGMVTVADAITGKLPKPEVGETLMFFTEDGLSRRDPRQPELPFAVSPPAADEATA